MTPHLYHPKTRDELAELLKKEMDILGLHGNFNHIDVSSIKDMSSLFSYSAFEGDISEWDVSNVLNAECMFYRALFNGDISRWCFSPQAQLQEMFTSSGFRGDLRQWTFPTYLAKSNPAPMFGWSAGSRHVGGNWESLRIPVWPVTFPVLFGYDELTSRDTAHAWLSQTPFCRYHWDVILYEHGKPNQSDTPWRHYEHDEHLRELLPTLQGLGLSPLEMAEQLHARWQMLGHEPIVLPLPSLD